MTFQDAVDTCVSDVLLHWRVFEVAIATMELEGLVTDLVAVVRSKELCHGTHLCSVGGIVLESFGCMSDYEA